MATPFLITDSPPAVPGARQRPVDPMAGVSLPPGTGSMTAEPAQPQQQAPYQYVGPPDPARGPLGYPNFETYMRDFNRARAEAQFMQQALVGANQIDEQISRINTVRRHLATRRLAKMVETGVPVEKAMAANPAAWMTQETLGKMALGLMDPSGKESFTPQVIDLTNPVTGQSAGQAARVGPQGWSVNWKPKEGMTLAQRGELISKQLSAINDQLKIEAGLLPPQQWDKNPRIAPLVEERTRLMTELRRLTDMEPQAAPVQSPPTPPPTPVAQTQAQAPVTQTLTRRFKAYIPGQGVVEKEYP